MLTSLKLTAIRDQLDRAFRSFRCDSPRNHGGLRDQQDGAVRTEVEQAERILTEMRITAIQI